MSDTVPTITLRTTDDVAFITFSRPEAANTIDMRFGREFLAATFAVEASGARAVVLSGQGRNFCFGGDLNAMTAAGDGTFSYLDELTTNLHAGMAHLAQLDAPVIAAVNGTAAGAGLGLVLMADLAIAARSSKFVSAYTAVGLTPDAGVTFLLPRAVGAKRAMDMILLNRSIDAETALEWGLVNDVVDDDALLAGATALAMRLAAGPLKAHGAVKRLLAESEPGRETQMAREGRCIASRATSDEGIEGISAFLQKRKARYA